MKGLAFAGTVLVCATLLISCSRKAAQSTQAAPEVLVTTVQPRDVPRVL